MLHTSSFSISFERLPSQSKPNFLQLHKSLPVALHISARPLNSLNRRQFNYYLYSSNSGSALLLHTYLLLSLLLWSILSAIYLSTRVQQAKTQFTITFEYQHCFSQEARTLYSYLNITIYCLYLKKVSGISY